MKCPNCEGKFGPSKIVPNSDGKSFACPKCRTDLDLSTGYKYGIFGVWLILSGLVTYFAGFRNPFGFVIVACVICFFGSAPFAAVMRWIIPPRLSLYYPEDMPVGLWGRRRGGPD